MVTKSEQLERLANSTPDSKLSRLKFVDNLRIFLTILVIAHHAGQPYGPTGGRWLIFNTERSAFLGPFFSVNAAFFMGFFFLLSGYFTPGSYDRKGATAFLNDRFLRLGIPIALFALGIFPLVLYFTSSRETSFSRYLFQSYLGQGQLEVGHLWFLVHLLLYAICYALWRRTTHSKPRSIQKLLPVPEHRAILAYLVALSLVTFLVRIWYPIDTWEGVLGIITAEVAHLPQYLSLFVIGLISYQHDWFRRIPVRQGLVWLGIGVGAVILRYSYSLHWRQYIPTQLIESGGLNWQSLVWSSWESTICVGLCVGLLILFREWGDRQGRLLRILSANAYTVYLIHILVILGLQFSFANIDIDPFWKFVCVTSIGVLLCFWLSHSIRKFPWFRMIL